MVQDKGVIMELKQWSKLILSFYKYLETSVSAIDKFVLDKCLYTSYYNRAQPLSLVKKIDNVAEFIDKKRRFINLKVIIENAIIEMPTRYQKLVILEYFDGVSANDQAELLGVNVRTIFRYRKLALSSFACALNKTGYDASYFEKNYKNEVMLFRDFDNPENKNQQHTNYKLKKALIKDRAI